MLNYRLKSYIILLAFFCISTGVHAQGARNLKGPKLKGKSTAMKAGAFIDVNVPPYPASTYAADQLVRDVLITGGSACLAASVSNVTVFPNQPVTNENRFWGYFNKGTTNFPFDDGIVLSTGYAKAAGNTTKDTDPNFYNNQGNQIAYGQSDPDLVAATGITQQQLHDAVALEFDFVPNTNQVKFNYIFASEEYYQGFPCDFSDAFALLIRPATGGPYVNVAILPNNAGPVRVTNIRPDLQFDGSSLYCGALNEMYFDGYNNNNGPVVTNFNGRTVPLTAIADVTPGVAYHFKMVLADAGDQSYDSAVFLEGGSFDIGMTIVDGNGNQLTNVNMCDNTPQLLKAQIAAVPGMTYQWYKDGVAIPGATAATYTATQPGVYEVRTFVAGTQCQAATVTITGGTSPIVQNATLTACYTTGNPSFNLTLAQPFISTTATAVFKYYTTQADAVAGNTSNIAVPTAFTSAGNQTIYVNVSSGFCSRVAQLQLVKAPQMTATITTPPKITCASPQITLNAATSVYPAGSTFNWVASGGGNIVSGANTLSPVVNAVGTYTLTVTKIYQPGGTCTATASVNVTEDKVKPVITVTASDMIICDGESVVLTAAGGVSYTWTGMSGTGSTQTVTPSTTTTYTVTGIGANGCAAELPATVTITVVPAIKSTLQGGQICTGDRITLDAGTGPNYTYTWSNGSTSQTITVDATGTYTVIINNGVCSKLFTAQVVQAAVPEIIKVDYNNGMMVLTASNPSNGPLEYSIDNGATWQASNVFSNVPKNTVVQIQVKVKNTSCVGFLEYFTFTMSNVITPNGDNVNDIIDFRGISQYNQFNATIFDRYGREIFKGSKMRPYWDGYFQGKRLPTSSYWYQVSFEDPASKQVNVKTGWILLKNIE